MSYVADYTSEHLVGYENYDVKVLNFMCKSVRYLGENTFQVEGVTLDKKKEIKFFVDKTQVGQTTNCSVFAPNYTFTIRFHPNDEGTYFIISEEIYYNQKDCRLGINQIHFGFGEDEKQFLNTPFNTLTYFESDILQGKKKTFGKKMYE